MSYDRRGFLAGGAAGLAAAAVGQIVEWPTPKG